MTLRELLESPYLNDRRGVQKALREIDTNVLSVALSDMPVALREKLYRNMTERSRAIIEREIELVKASGSACFSREHLPSERAGEMVVDAILEYASDRREQETSCPVELPAVRLNTCAEVVDTLERIDDHAFRYGLMAIEGLERAAPDPFFKKAIALLLDGIEPLLFERLLDNHRERFVAAYAARLSLISEGMKSIQAGDSPLVLREKLASLAPAD